MQIQSSSQDRIPNRRYERRWALGTLYALPTAIIKVLIMLNPDGMIKYPAIPPINIPIGEA